MASTSAAHHSSSSAAASSRSDCPCKRLSLSLSSATSAEYGDVVSLARRIRNSSSSSSSSSVAKFGGGGGRGRPSRIGVGPGQSSSSTSSSSSAGGDANFLNDGGITPLHLAAQHNHAGAVRLLLGEGGRDVDTGLVVASTATPSPSGGMGGATPLHRASFSGAISSMRVLLSWGTDDDDDDDDDDGGGGGRIRPPGGGRRAADLLARDASYGDLRTPLHKAVAGGRPLAVQLLILCASRRRGRGGVFRGAMMRARDASGRTPLESARTYASMSPDEAEVERASVRRWDAVAGGAGADWATCLRLLERAAADDVARDGALTSTSMTTTMGMMTPTPDSEEASAALAEGGEAATSRRRGRPRQLVPPICQKVPETFDDFFNETGNNAYCGDNEGDAACRDGRCLSAAWERTFRTALASSIEMSLDGGGDGGATTPPVDGRGMTTTTTTADLVRYVNNDDVDEVPIINEEFSPSNRPTASIIAQMRSAAKREVEMSSDDCPSFLAEVAVVRNNDESIADENTTAMGRRCDSCGMQTIALFRSMANHQLVCRQCRRRRGR